MASIHSGSLPARSSATAGFNRRLCCRSILLYGIPDAGQAFAMLMFGLHIKHCGMTQCDVDPSIYSKYELDVNGRTKEYLFVITWTDDVIYFGTPRFVTKYASYPLTGIPPYPRRELLLLRPRVYA